MAALFGLLAAAFWGVGDFSGGMAVKAVGGSVRAALRVIVLSHTASFCVLLALALSFSGPLPHGALLAWGLGAGVMAGLSLSAFYIALSRGAMGASAAVSGLLAAAIPAAVSMVRDGAPGWMHGAGFVVASAAIWLIAAGPAGVPAAKEQASTLALAVGAGAGFGLYFVALKFANGSGVLWPMATARVGSLMTCGLLLLLLPRGGEAETVAGRAGAWVLGTALFDTCGNLLFVAATRAGRLDMASVLASLYPASTILLASLLLKERLTRRQGWGMAVATLAVVLITMKRG